MTSLDMIFHVVVSVYRSLKIWNSPQFPAEFRNGPYREVRSSFCRDMQARDTEKKQGPNIRNRNKREQKETNIKVARLSQWDSLKTIFSVHIFAHCQDFR